MAGVGHMARAQSGKRDDSHVPDRPPVRRVRLLVRRGLFESGAEITVPRLLAERWINAAIAVEVVEKIQERVRDKMMRPSARK